MPMSPFLLKYLPPWGLWIIGGIFAIGGVFLSSFVTSYIAFVLIYPTLFGIGVGFSYMAPIVSGWEYFPTKRGVVSGLIVGGFGFGSFIFGFISLANVNPDGKSPEYEVNGGKIFDSDDDISSNAPKMLRINCAIWLGLLLIALPMMRRKTKPNVLLDSKNDKIFRGTNNDSSERTNLISTSDTNDLTVMDWIKEFRFIHLWIIIVLSSSYPYYIASNFKSYEEIDVHDDKFITIVGSIGAVLNGISRGFWSSLQDYFGFKKVYMWLLVLEIVIAFTFVLVHKVEALYLIWVCCSYAWLGGHFSIFPTLWAQIYGPINGGKVYSILFTGFATATMMNWLLSKQSGKSIGYDVLFYILASLAVIAFVLAIFLNTNPKIKNKVKQNISNISHSF